MKKTAASKSLMDFEHNLCILAMIVLVIGGAIFAYKFFKTKNAWQMQSVTVLHSLDQQRILKANEDANAIALSLQYPSSNPLYKQPRELQNYVAAFSKHTGRDVVVVDTNKVILADTVAKNVGATFKEDKKSEVTMTIADSTPRQFVEQGVDYPNGIAQTVVALHDASGKTVGAVILSTSNVMR